MEELRVFGVFEKLDSLIDHYLRARSIPLLLEKILARLEKVHIHFFFISD
jgi:hypothetical protein